MNRGLGPLARPHARREDPAATATLRAQQRLLSAAIADPGAATGILAAPPGGGAPRIGLYRHAYRVRLTEALAENYPVLRHVLGDEAFADLAAGYIAARPSPHRSIRWFGDDLAGWLDGGATALPHPALADLARMEWALGTAFDGADAEPLRVADLLAVPPDDWAALAFVPHPTVRLVALRWAVEPLWSRLTADSEAATEAPEARAHHLAAWRRDDRTQWRSVDALEAELLSACLAGASFASLCATAEAHVGTGAAAAAAGHLRAWVEAGMLAGLRRGCGT